MRLISGWPADPLWNLIWIAPSLSGADLATLCIGGGMGIDLCRHAGDRAPATRRDNRVVEFLAGRGLDEYRPARDDRRRHRQWPPRRPRGGCCQLGVEHFKIECTCLRPISRPSLQRLCGSPRWLSAGAAAAAPLKSRFARPGLGQPGLPKGTFAEVSVRLAQKCTELSAFMYSIF